MGRYLLGIDVGTTGTKTILFTQHGQILGQSYQGYPTATPQVGFCEQDPRDWWNAVCCTVKDVCKNIPDPENVAAISLSTQGGTMVCVDESFEPLAPAIVWNDTRCTQELQEFIQEQGEEDSVYQKCGWKLDAGAPCLHPRWLRKHKPEAIRQAAMYVSVPDYIAYRMTKKPALDISNAGINRFYDIQNRRYDPVLMEFGGMQERQFSQVVPSCEAIGNLTAQAAAELGLSTDAVLVAGAHDQYAVALGAGACHPGDTLIGSGTCWVVTSIQDEADFASGLAQSVSAIPGKWGSIWSLSSGGICLEWWRKNLTVDRKGTLISFEQIIQEVDKRKAAENGLFFVPFSGYAEGKKGFDKATFVGLDLSHDRYHMARAIMEGVAFQIVWMLDAFPGQQSERGLIIAGGASKSSVWCQMVADIANLPIHIPETADLGCVGAAIMAGVGCGIFASAEDGYKRFFVPERILYPDPARAQTYKHLMEQYRQTANALTGVYNI